MDIFIPTAPISPLRQRLIDDMTMREFSRETQRNYIRDVSRPSWDGGPTRRRPRTCAVSRSNSARPASRCRP